MDYDKILNVLVGGMVFAAFALWIVRVQTKKRPIDKTKTEATKDV